MFPDAEMDVIVRRHEEFMDRGKAETRRRSYWLSTRRKHPLASSSTSLPGRLVRLTAFPTAVFDPQLGGWQLSLPEG